MPDHEQSIWSVIRVVVFEELWRLSLKRSWMHQPKGVYGSPWHMSSLTSPKKAKDAVSSSEPESKNQDKVSEAFSFKSLRCFLYSLLEGKEVCDKWIASGGIGIETFEEEGFEGDFFEDIHWQILGIYCEFEGTKFVHHLTLNSLVKCVGKTILWNKKS